VLAELRADLLRGRPHHLRPDEGEEAFRQHKLLATAVHRAAKLDQRKDETETNAWVRYIVQHYPVGRNNEADARLLFADWRTSLLKRDTPGPSTAITHGQSALHWQRDESDRLCINLEDAWSDYAASVESFISYLRASPRWKVVLGRWQKQQWVVEPFVPVVGAITGATVMGTAKSASVAESPTTVARPNRTVRL
jgi:hypothetical protein